MVENERFTPRRELGRTGFVATALGIGDLADRSLPLIAELLAGEPDWGDEYSDRPVVLVAHGGLIAALTAALLRLPVDSWPVLGGMGNASWAQLSGHGPAGGCPDDIRWRLDVWNASAQVANDVL